jgi:competence protein ComEC
LTPRAGQKWQLGAVELQILAPILPLLGDSNDDSIVCRLTFGESRVLFTGDIEADAEARLVSRRIDLRCTVLKVAHHGSKTSSGAAFLRAARPALALISCGRFNRFGHPTPQTLRALQDTKTATFRTDLSGAIEVECDTVSCRATPFR